uniref:Peptidylprolyl isomerase n=1 Tax=Palpitomonas bilix TaxID=652834 RepID=A0A7S3GEU1_9EUKA|mmetsp:Transcript_46327/g.119567  ORF Transcript_46327/g.119567 Transcript_46327/m.119567 type:complete len:240 (+) Transcript_46327:54-773(+)
MGWKTFLAIACIFSHVYLASSDLAADLDTLATKLKLSAGQISINAKDGSLSTVEKNVEEARSILSKIEAVTRDLKHQKSSSSSGADGSDAASQQPLHEPVTELEVKVTGEVSVCSKRVEEGDSLRVHYIGKDLQTGNIFSSTFHTGSIPERLRAEDEEDQPLLSALQGACEEERRRIKFPRSLVEGSRFESGEGGDVQFDVEVTSISKARQNVREEEKAKGGKRRGKKRGKGKGKAGKK